MDLNKLNRIPNQRKKRMVRKGRGPGTGKGKTCGRGHKGQQSRTGASKRFYFEGGQMPLVRRLPKVGFTNIFRKDIIVLNVSALNSFDDGAEVTPKDMLKAGLINRLADGVKLLGDGDLEKKLTVKAHRFSKSARAKIEGKGGTCEIIEIPVKK
ncbi:50S ribosomal protein L15 [Planctomycetota bacterium]|nr:50S ribosomal protein L15 [Planctomycetota bacterium]